MARTAPLLGLITLLACPQVGPEVPDSGAPPPAIKVVFLQAQDGAFYANPEINAVLPVRLRAEEAETVQVSLAGTAKNAQRLDDGSWIAEFNIEGLEDGTVAVDALALKGDLEGRIQVQLTIGRQGRRLTVWEEVGSADSPQLHRSEGQLYLSWTDRRAEPRGGLIQPIDGSGQGLSEPVPISPADQEVARVHVAFGDGLIGVIHQQLLGEGRRHWISVLDLEGRVLMEPVPLEPEGAMGRFQHVIAFDGDAWVAAWRMMRADEVEVIQWVRFSELGILAGPKEIVRAGAHDPHGGFLPYIQMRIAARRAHSVVSFTRDYWDAALEMGINRNQVVVLDPTGEQLEGGILPHSLLMPFEFESHVHRVGDEIFTLSTASSLADEELYEPHRVFASRVPETFPSPPHDWGHHLVLNAPRTRGEMIVVPHEMEWGVMAWTDERGRDQPGSPQDKIQLLVATVSSPDAGFRLGAHSSVLHARLFSGLAKLSGQSLGSSVLLVWIDERSSAGGQSRPEVFMETVWY